MTPLWIGGAPGCGKSTVARTLARRHGLRWYNADTRAWAHRDAARRGGDPDAERFERLDPAERWRRPVPELLRMSLHHVRGPMTAADVRALPEPITIAEGTTVTPVVAGTDPAVWLLASRETRAVRLSGRGLNPGQLALYLELGDVIATEVADAGAPRLLVDELDVAAVTAAVERLFAARLAIGPTARTTAERAELAAWANAAIVEQCRPAVGHGDDRGHDARVRLRVRRVRLPGRGAVACRRLRVTAAGRGPLRRRSRGRERHRLMPPCLLS